MEQQFKNVVKGTFLTIYSGYAIIGGIFGLCSLLSFGELLTNLNLAIYGQRVESMVIETEKPTIEFTGQDGVARTFSPNMRISFAGEENKYQIGQKIEVVYTSNPFNMEIYSIAHMLLLPLGFGVFCGLLAFLLLSRYYSLLRA